MIKDKVSPLLVFSCLFFFLSYMMRKITFSLYLIIVFLIFLSFSIVFSYHLHNRNISELLISGLLGIIIAFSLLLSVNINLNQDYLNLDKSDISSVVGIVRSDGFFNRNMGFTTIRLTIIQAESLKRNCMESARLRASLLIKGNYILKKGMRILIRGTISIKKRENVKNYKVYAKSDDIDLLGFNRFFSKERVFLLERIDSRINSFGYPTAGFLRALFLGNRTDLSVDLLEEFRKSGTFHVLALSGIHVGIIYMLLSLVFFPLKDGKMKFAFIATVLLAYLFLVGMRASLGRASFMLIIFSFLRIIDKRVGLLDILALTGVILTILSPDTVYDVSFGLSFLAVLGIATAGRIVFFYLRGTIPSFLLTPLATGFGAQVTCSILLVLSFGEIHPIGIIASILVVPLIGFFLWISIPLLFIPDFMFSIFKKLLLPPVNALYFLIVETNRFFSFVPGVKIESKRLTVAILLAVILFIGIVFLPYEEKMEEPNDKLRFSNGNQKTP